MEERILELLKAALGESHQTGKTNHAFQCPVWNHYKRKLEVNIADENYNCWICGKTHGTSGKSLIGLLTKIKARPEIISEMRTLLNKPKWNGTKFSDEKVAVPVHLPAGFIPLYSNTNSIEYRNALHYITNTRGISLPEIVKYGIGMVD